MPDQHETRVSPSPTTDVELLCPLWKQPFIRLALFGILVVGVVVSVIALGGYVLSVAAYHTRRDAETKARTALAEKKIADDGAAKASKAKLDAESDAEKMRIEARTIIRDAASAIGAIHFEKSQTSIFDGDYPKARFQLASAIYADGNVDFRSALWQLRHSSFVSPTILAWKESHEAIAVSTDGTVIAATSTNGRLCLWEKQNSVFGGPRVFDVVPQNSAAQKDSFVLESVAVDTVHRRVAIGARSGDISVLDFDGHSQFVAKAVAAKWLLFSPNGRWMVGGGQSSIRIWNTADWKDVELAHGTDCTAIAFDATSRFLGAGLKNVLAIWEITDHSPEKWHTRRTAVESGVIRSIAVFTLGGTVSILAGTDSVSRFGESPHGIIYAFELFDHSQLPELKSTWAVNGDVRSIGGDHRFPWYAIVRLSNGRRCLWDNWTGKQMGWLAKGPIAEFSWMGSACLSPFANIAAISRDDAELLVFDPLSAIGTMSRFRLEAKIVDLRFRPNHDILAIGLADGRVVLHDIYKNSSVTEWQAFDGVTGELAKEEMHGRLGFTKDGNIIVASRQNRIRLFELGQNGSNLEQIGPDLTCVSNVAGVYFVDGGTTLLTGSRNLVRHKFDTLNKVKNGSAEIAIERDVPYATDITAIGVSSNGRYGAFADRAEGTGIVDLFMLNADSRPPFSVESGIGDLALGVAVSPDDRWIVTTNAVWTVEEKSLKRHQRLYDQTFPLRDVEFSPDGDLLAAVGGGLRIWRTSDWSKPIVDLRLGDTLWSIVRFSLNGHRLAVADGAGIVHMFDVSKLIDWFQQPESSLVEDELKTIGRSQDEIIADDRRLGSIKWLRENPEPR